MLVIESNLMISSTSNWVLDSSFSTYLCTSMQDLEDSRRLKDGEMILCIKNGARITDGPWKSTIFDYRLA